MIAAACVIRLRNTPRYHIAQSGTAVWSGWGLSGDQSLGVVAFNELANELNDAALGDGDSITVHGNLQLEEWTGNDGQTRHGLKLIASKVDPVRPPARKKRSRTPAARGASLPDTGSVPFNDELPTHF